MRKLFVALLLSGIALALIALFILLGRLQEPVANGLQQGSSDAMAGELQSLRASYGIPLAVFEELPAAPQDFNRLVSLMHAGKFYNYAFFPEQYFLQPEFYPSFQQHGIGYWTTPNPTHYGAMGFGFFPGMQSVELKGGSSATARFFVHTAFGVESYQGIRIEAEIPEEARFLKVEMPEQEFLLSPSFPKFTRNWSKAVDVKIAVPENSPAGSYEINFRVVAPSPENAEEWKSQANGRYFDASSAGAGIYHKLTVRVN